MQCKSAFNFSVIRSTFNFQYDFSDATEWMKRCEQKKYYGLIHDTRKATTAYTDKRLLIPHHHFHIVNLDIQKLNAWTYNICDMIFSMKISFRLLSCCPRKMNDSSENQVKQTRISCNFPNIPKWNIFAV